MRSWALYLFYVLPLCDAWGNLAHRTIGFLAQKHFTPEALEYTQDLLGKETIDSAAIWADTYKLLPWGRKTGSWHFVDAQDNPPSSCSVDYHRDCQPNRTCIITAIADMTDEITDPTVARKGKKKALKFLLHLIGDLHCPLHAESIARGGNDIPVLYHDQNTNLHFVWDVLMPREAAKGEGQNEVEVAKRWAGQLYNSTVGEPYTLTFDSSYGPEAPSSSMAAFGARDDSEELLLRWAREANALVCRMVLKDGVEAIKGKELSGEYFDDSIAIIERQIALSGVRLAMWINSIAAIARDTAKEREELR